MEERERFDKEMTRYTAVDDEREEILQREYMEKAASYVAELTKELGRGPKGCVVTFGCQMNVVHGIQRAPPGSRRQNARKPCVLALFLCLKIF